MIRDTKTRWQVVFRLLIEEKAYRFSLYGDRSLVVPFSGNPEEGLAKTPHYNLIGPHKLSILFAPVG